MGRRIAGGFTLVELLVVMTVLAVLMAVLLPTLSRVRKSAVMSKLESESRATAAAPALPAQNDAAPRTDDRTAAAPPPTAPAVPLAHVSSFDADVTLTPRLSVGTAEPESIYEASFSAKIEAAGDRGSTGTPGGGPCRIELPLPPQIISLADLSVTVDGQPSDTVAVRGDKLVWEGTLPASAPAQVGVTYSAVGRGLYALQTPPGKIVDHFRIQLTASGSDVRMIELSMQPTSLTRAGGRTTYTWEYKRLMFGRPIAMDVLGIAPIDRLGELSWLGPLSVVAFGLIVGLVAYAFAVRGFDRWMLLLILGTFTGAYPLMYFAQEFIPLSYAIGASAAAVLVVIAWRAFTLMGVRLGMAGVVLPAGVIMSLTLMAALRPSLQSILLTGLSLGLFVLAMVLAPRLRLPHPPPQPSQALA